MMPGTVQWTFGKVLLTAGRVLLGGIFVYASYTKLSQPWVLLAMSIEAYKVLPESIRDLLAHALPWFELAIGGLLVFGFWMRTVASIASALLIGFFSIMAYSYATHPEGSGINCGCFGFGEAISPGTLLRDGILVIVAIAVTIGAFRIREIPGPGASVAPQAEPQRAS
ncbi:MAG: DoxX family membrane protein [Acidobacteria bacterium]|nr:DoxX family membrane protein [Acidobacteriota bacterium]